MIRHLFGLPPRRDGQIGGGYRPSTALRLGVGDMLAWGVHYAQVEAVVSVGEGLDAARLSDGATTVVVIFDHARARVWSTEATTQDRPGWAVTASAIWGGDEVLVRRKPQAVHLRIGGMFFVADLSQEGSLAQWVNAFGQPIDPREALPGPYMDPRDAR